MLLMILPKNLETFLRSFIVLNVRERGVFRWRNQCQSVESEKLACWHRNKAKETIISDLGIKFSENKVIPNLTL